MQTTGAVGVYPDLAGKVAVVTGGSGGIGAATCRLLAANGARVVVNGRDQARIQAVVDGIGAGGGEAIGVAGDCTDLAAIERLRQQVEQDLGPAEVLAAFVGGGRARPGPVADVPEDDWWSTVDGSLTIVDPPCEFDAFNVDLARDTSEVAHGFVDLWGTDCNADFGIDYFEGSGTTWTHEATPYSGFVVAVAWDTTGTYLLYVDAARLELRITKRLTNGTYTGGRLLSTHVGPDGSSAQGDVVASGGQWWAVWREHVAPSGSSGNEFDQTDLFQAYTIGGTLHPRQRITSNPLWDGAPSLALTPATTFPLRLVWSRGGSDFGAPTESDLRRALGNASGGWISATLATAGFLNLWPDVQMLGTTTYVAWNRDGRTVQANNASGTFLSHTFNTPAAQSHRPRMAVSPGNLVVGWTVPTSTSFRAFVAERVGSSWTGTYASPSATRL